MKPNITFHHISSMELTDPRTIQHSDRDGTFACRKLILTDEDGDKFYVNLFAAVDTNLMLVPSEKGVLCS